MPQEHIKRLYPSLLIVVLRHVSHAQHFHFIEIFNGCRMFRSCTPVRIGAHHCLLISLC